MSKEIDIERLEELKTEWDANDGMLTPSELYESCKLLLSFLEKEKMNNRNNKVVIDDFQRLINDQHILLKKEKERADKGAFEAKSMLERRDELITENAELREIGEERLREINKAEERVKELVEAVERYKNIRDGLRSDVEEVMGSAEIPYYEQELYKVLEEVK